MFCNLPGGGQYSGEVETTQKNQSERFHQPIDGLHLLESLVEVFLMREEKNNYLIKERNGGKAIQS